MIQLRLFGYLQTVQGEKPWGIVEEHLPDIEMWKKQFQLSLTRILGDQNTEMQYKRRGEYWI